jgi:hypothetical protein
MASGSQDLNNPLRKFKLVFLGEQSGMTTVYEGRISRSLRITKVKGE